ncbi:hypothetical protein D9M69_551530 [compost metagenome]
MRLPRKGSFTGYNGAGGEAQHFLRFHTQLETVNSAGFSHQHLCFLVIGHCRNEFVCCLFNERERAVMTRQYSLEIEIALAGECGNSATHGEAITNRHDADFWLMQFIDESHVGENIRVTHMI